ncbi:holin [Sapientia aquatica]|uniref:Holin n=2 Tax=Sapientia aquatica TaxID=1549640 RepID=A0A4R5W8T0_9BURK|nr:holin [Sapientia aquatica]
MLAKLLWTMLPGAMGSIVALKFLGDELSFGQKLTSFFSGLACAVYVAPILLTWFSIEGERVIAGVEFLAGLFSMVTCRELFKEINHADILGALKRRYLGDKNDELN